MSDIPQPVIDVLKEIGETAKTSTWDCHGTRVILHKALEKIAAKKGIEFYEPVHLVTDPANKQVVIQVTGIMQDAKGQLKKEWSIGEVAPNNCKNGYPFAMAEKRAKDRVILKLAGLHGYVYSEDEAEDFKDSKPSEGNDLLEYNETVREHWDWINGAKEAIANEDWYSLAGMWGDIDHETMATLFRAPTKGGIFTTEERAACKGNDAFNQARKELANGV
jgi:hypothetical protein